MASDGKQLEGLVSFVEKTLLPQGFEVKTNERVYNDEGIQIAEFDIEIRGKVGSTSIAWLIECRDRPSQGPAPGSWIEQLVGRRMRFGFNKVTAVSTTGFAAGVGAFAQTQGIELREVKALSVEEFADWLALRHSNFIEHRAKLNHASILVNERESKERQEALLQAISSQPGDSKFLLSSKSGEMVSAATAFCSSVSQVGNLFDDLEPNGLGKKIRLKVQYIDDNHFVVATSLGPVRVEEIEFFGELSVHESLIPLMVTAEYCRTETGEPISQVASFAPQVIHGTNVSLELHKIAETGETHVIMRKLSDTA